MAPTDPKHAGSVAKETAQGAVHQAGQVIWTCEHTHEAEGGKTARQVATECAQEHLNAERQAQKEATQRQREQAAADAKATKAAAQQQASDNAATQQTLDEQTLSQATEQTGVVEFALPEAETAAEPASAAEEKVSRLSRRSRQRQHEAEAE